MQWQDRVLVLSQPPLFILHCIAPCGKPQPIREDTWGNLPPFVCNIL